MTGEESKQKAIEEYEKNLLWSMSLSAEQINFLFDAGYYNDALKGYLVYTLLLAQVDKSQFERIMECGKLTLETLPAEELRKVTIGDKIGGGDND